MTFAQSAEFGVKITRCHSVCASAALGETPERVLLNTPDISVLNLSVLNPNILYFLPAEPLMPTNSNSTLQKQFYLVITPACGPYTQNGPPFSDASSAASVSRQTAWYHSTIYPVASRRGSPTREGPPSPNVSLGHNLAGRRLNTPGRRPSSHAGAPRSHALKHDEGVWHRSRARNGAARP